MLILEDLHWADASTRDFLTFLVRNARTEPLCLVVTYRSDELHRRHPLRPLLAELERVQGVERLGPRALHARRGVGPGGGDPRGRGARRPHRPAVRARRGQRALHGGAAGGEWRRGELPETLRDALLNRVERLPAAALEVVRVIAVEHPMPHPLLNELSPLDAAETTAGVREAIAQPDPRDRPLRPVRVPARARRRGGVRRPAAGRAQRAAPAARRGRRGDPGLLGDVPQATVAAQLACHWHAAHDVPRALGAAVEAGRAAKRVFAFREAQRHYERALELWDRVPDAEERAGCDRIDVLRHAAVAAAHAARRPARWR